MKLTGIPRASHLPRMARVKQQFAGPMLQDIPAAVRQTLGSLALPIKPGQSVALAVGSRGIVNIDVIAKAAVEHVKALGGQAVHLPRDGEPRRAAPPRASAPCSSTTASPRPRWAAPCAPRWTWSRSARRSGCPSGSIATPAEADWIGILNRVKPHTDFVGEIESGLFKMMTIGVGKHRGAVQAHRAAVRHRYEPMVVAFGREVLRKARIAFGLGIVENGYDETALVQAFLPGALEAGERELLRQAKSWMARLPFEQIDLLIVDEMGKDISGSGMDSNIIGRHGTFFEPPYTSPKVTFIVVCDLTAHTYGNAIGIGSADFATRRLVDKIDWEATYVNGLTACSPGRLQDAGDARLGAGGDRGRAVVPRARSRGGRPGRADQEHAQDHRGGRLGEPAPRGRQAGRPLAGRRPEPRSPSTRPATSSRSDGVRP